VVGVTYSLLALFVVIPAFRGTPSDTLIRYQWLGDTPLQISWTILSQPKLILEKLLAAGNVLNIVQLLAPLAFVPLVSLPALFPVLPTLVYNVLSELNSQATIYYHYMAPVIPCVYVSTVFGLLALATWKHKLLQLVFPWKLPSDQAVALGITVLLFATLASWNYQNPIIGNTSLSAVAPLAVRPGANGQPKSLTSVIRPNDAAIRDGLKRIPYDAYLLTTNNYLPHLSHRRRLEGIPWVSPAAVRSGVEAIFLNLNDLRRMSCDTYLDTLKVAARSGFGVSFYRDAVLVLEKGKGDAGRFHALLNNGLDCE
jgi:uncharacterized membrane protein